MINQKNKNTNLPLEENSDINVTAQGHDYTHVSEFLGCFPKLLCKKLHERSLELPNSMPRRQLLVTETVSVWLVDKGKHLCAPKSPTSRAAHTLRNKRRDSAS